MAFEETLVNITLVSSIDWTDPANQYIGVSVNAAGEAAIAISGETVVGVMQNNPRTGGEGTVGCRGVTKATAGGAIAIGNAVTVNATGQFTDAGAPPTGAANEVGVALSAAGAANEICSVLLT